MADFFFEPTPHTEAAKLIADKPVVSRRVFDEMLPEIKARVFTITGIEDATVMQTVRDRIAELPQGGDWNTLKHQIIGDISPFLDDPALSEEENQAAAAARAEILLRVHGHQAYMATRHRALTEQKDVFPYWEYVTVGDDKVRDSHAALDGLIFPAGHEFWQKHFPPWDWGCRCRIVARTAAEVGQIQQADLAKPPEQQRVIEGPRLQQAVNGHLHTAQGTVSIAPQTGDTAFHATPGDLRIPLKEIQGRYDADIFAQFEAAARREELAPGVSVWAWLSGAPGSGSSAGVPPAWPKPLRRGEGPPVAPPSTTPAQTSIVKGTDEQPDRRNRSTENRPSPAAIERLARQATAADAGRERRADGNPAPFTVAESAARERAAQDRLSQLRLKRPELIADPDPALPNHGGAEHVVQFPSDGLVHKYSTGFGNIVRRDGIFPRATATEYLDRLLLWNETFGDDIRLVGISQADGRIGFATTMRKIVSIGRDPTDAEIARLLATLGFEQTGYNEVFYNPRTRILLTDAAPRNFILDPAGQVHPIDLGVQRVEPGSAVERWLQAGGGF